MVIESTLCFGSAAVSNPNFVTLLQSQSVIYSALSSLIGLISINYQPNDCNCMVEYFNACLYDLLNVYLPVR